MLFVLIVPVVGLMLYIIIEEEIFWNSILEYAGVKIYEFKRSYYERKKEKGNRELKKQKEHLKQ